MSQRSHDAPERTYYAPHGGLPPQSQLIHGRAVFTEAYAVIPKGVMSDIVTSFLPHWENTRLWVLSRPLSGFAENFYFFFDAQKQVREAAEKICCSAHVDGAAIDINAPAAVLQ